MLQHAYPRVPFFAAHALGRLKSTAAVEPLVKLLRRNDDRDLYIRHSAVLALARIGAEGQMVALKNHDSRALRTAAILVLRRLASPSVAEFLSDADPYLVTEAARAIHDDESIPEALPALARLVATSRHMGEPLMRRALSACQRVGGTTELDMLVKFAGRTDVPTLLRTEAIACLSTWTQPSETDRVDGRYRGKVNRNADEVTSRVKEIVPQWLTSTDSEVLAAVGQLIGDLQITGHSDQLVGLATRHRSPQVRSSMLTALALTSYEGLEALLTKALQDTDASVRSAAVGFLDQVTLDSEKLSPLVNGIFEKGSLSEQQQLLKVLGQMPLSQTEMVFDGLIEQWRRQTLKPEIRLDLAEAIEASGSSNAMRALDELRTNDSPLLAFQETLHGGSRRAGWRLFNEHPTAQCTRCHSLDRASAAEMPGPPLYEIGSQLTREQILEALVDPSARIAPGYGVAMLTLTDGQVSTGTVLSETPDEIEISTPNAEPLVINKGRIQARENLPSSMPGVTHFLSKREIRDLVEFLANLKGNEM